MALENCRRKPRTAARFVLEACKTQAWKTLGTSPLECIKNMSLTAHGLGKPPAKASNSSRIRARSIQNTSLKNSRNVTFGIHKKHVSHGTWPWKTAAESLEQQQDSCPKHAKHKPEKLSERHLWNPKKKHVYHGTWPWKTACESLEQQQDSCSKHAKHKPENSRNVTFGIHKKHVSHGTWPWKTACESLEQQQDSCPKHAKHKPEKLSKHHDTWPWKTALENCLRKPRTAAGFVVEACRTQAWKTLGTSPLESIKNMSITAHGLGKPPAKAPWKTLGTSPLESMKNMFLTAHGLGKPPPKASNSSRIRARSMQNTSQKNSRNVTFETKKKTCLSRHMALEACKTQAWKTLRTSLENTGVPPDDFGNRPDHSTLHPLESLPDDSGNKTFNVLQTASEKPEQRQVQNTLENRTPNSSKLLGALPPDSKGVGGFWGVWNTVISSQDFSVRDLFSDMVSRQRFEVSWLRLMFTMTSSNTTQIASAPGSLSKWAGE